MARILILEDEPLIAMLLEDWLTEMGHEPVGPIDCVDTALAVLQNSQIDAAIVDINIRGRRSDPVAAVLQERSIPYAFATGSPSDFIGECFSTAPTLAKPYDFAAVGEIVGRLVMAGKALAAVDN